MHLKCQEQGLKHKTKERQREWDARAEESKGKPRAGGGRRDRGVGQLGDPRGEAGVHSPCWPSCTWPSARTDNLSSWQCALCFQQPLGSVVLFAQSLGSPPPPEEVGATVFPPVRRRGSSRAPICPLCSLRLCRYSTKLLSLPLCQGKDGCGGPLQGAGESVI